MRGLEDEGDEAVRLRARATTVRAVLGFAMREERVGVMWSDMARWRGVLPGASRLRAGSWRNEAAGEGHVTNEQVEV